MSQGTSLHRFNEIFKILKESGLISGVTPQKISQTLEKLGPTFIKIGQILSTRVDLIPNEYCEELARLRSNVNPIPYEEIEKILKEQYEDINKIFYYIDDKLIIYTDIQLFKKAVSLLHLNRIIKVMDLNEVIDQIYETTKEELDFNIETSHLIKFRNLHKDSKTVRCPNVYEKYCYENIIVMEYIDGIKINDTDSLKVNNYKLDVIANILSDNYIKQAITDGFFHADPHPDNIIIHQNNIVYIDFGMMGHLTEKNKQLLKKCIKAIIFRDYKEVSRILVNMSTKLDEIDYDMLSDDVANILEEFGDLELDSISTSKFISDMFSMLRRNHLALDKDVTMLIRGIGIIEPVLQALNPRISLFKVLIRSEEGKLDDIFDYNKLQRKSKELLKSAHDIASIPSEVASFLKAVNNGETKFKIELSESTKHVDKLENLVHEVILGFVDGCLIIATVLTEDKFCKPLFLYSVIVITIWLVIKMIMDIIHRGY